MLQNKVIEAPVVLFIYKRPGHTLKIIEKINQVKINKVYIIADGCKNETDRRDVEETRKQVTKIKTEVEKIFFEKNVGIRKNAEIGLKKVFYFEKKAIFLEDDTVPDISFFEFCDELLNKYSEKKEISMICGSNFKTQITEKETNDYFFSRYPFFWGWASWKDRWEHLFDNQMKKWHEYKSSKNFSNKFTNKREFNYWKERFDFHKNNLNLGSWDYPFFLNHFYYEKKSIVPKKNLIMNIGYDNPTSQNPKKTAKLKTFSLDFPLNHPLKFENNNNYDNFCSLGLFSKQKLFKRIKNKLNKIIKIFLKK